MKRARRFVLGALLVGTLAAAYFAPEASGGTDLVSDSVRDRARAAQRGMPSVHAATVTPLPVASGELAMPTDLPERVERASSVLFEPAEWGTSGPVLLALKVSAKPVSPMASAPTIAPPPPVPPPLPFKVLGWYQEGERRGVFLQHQGNNLVIHVGDKLGNEYVFESWTDRSMSVRYLPLNQLQTLEVGSYEN